jgi:DNA-binding GntR family transcriptional regulator
MVVEALCAYRAAERVTEKDILEIRGIATDMRQAYEQGDHARYAWLNHGLHRRIREISGQQTAILMLDRLRAQGVQYQRQLSVLPGRSNLSLPEHMAIVDEICARSPEGAERAMVRHLRNLVAALQRLKSLDRLPVR